MLSEKTKNKFLELFKLQISVSKIITVFIDLFWTKVSLLSPMISFPFSGYVQLFSRFLCVTLYYVFFSLSEWINFR